MDVKKTFLHGDLEEEINMKQPKCFVVKGKKELVCKLNNSLYGLKQSPRMWYHKFDTFIQGLGFTRSKADHCVYLKLIGDHDIYLVLYVDDMLLVGNEKESIHDFNTQLSSKFDMKDLCATNYILGMEIKRDQAKRKLWLNQRKYVETILQRFNMEDSKLVKVPIPVGVRLSAERCPKTQEEEEDMSHVPYASPIIFLRVIDIFGHCAPIINVHKLRAPKSLKVLLHYLKEQGQLITSSPRSSSPQKTAQKWSKLDHTECPVQRV
eukprot:PITA_30783